MPLVTFEAKRMPYWVMLELRYARREGWHGTILSGFRSPRQQLAAAAAYAAAAGTTVAALYPHGPLASNHCGRSWPSGAVDVTMPDQLARILDRPRTVPRGRRLVWAVDAGLADRAHFSRTGH